MNELANVLEDLVAETDDLRNLYSKWHEVIDELLPYAQRSYIGPLPASSVIKASKTLEEHRKAAGKARGNAKLARRLVPFGSNGDALTQANAVVAEAERQR